MIPPQADGESQISSTENSISNTETQVPQYPDLSAYESTNGSAIESMPITNQVVPQQLPDHACSYCGCFSPKCVVQCGICGRWFCNGRISKSSLNDHISKNRESHIVTHLVLSHHKSVKLHPDSDFGDTALECYKCGNRNVFSLGFVAAKQESVVVILCRMPCAQEKNPDWDVEHWQPLIENRQFLSWIVQEPTADEMSVANPISIADIGKLEASWHEDKDKNEETPELEEDESVLAPVLLHHDTCKQYQQQFLALIDVQRKYDEQLKELESHTFDHLIVHWDKGPSGTLTASFEVPSFKASSQFKLSCGDVMELSYDGPGVEKPWKSQGIIVSLPDAKSNQFILRFPHKGTPTNVELGFHAQLTFQDVPYERMERALNAMNNQTLVSPYLRQRILGQDPPDEDFEVEMPPRLSVPGATELNISQMNAVRTVLKKPLTLIQGPPGTGKTVTSATIVYRLVEIYKKKHEKKSNNENSNKKEKKSKKSKHGAEKNKHNAPKVLVCAPSNVAVDHLTLKLARMGLKVCRIFARSQEGIDSPAKQYSALNDIKKLAYPKMLSLIERKEAGDSLTGREFAQYTKFMKQMMDKIIRKSDVVCCTCVGSGIPALNGFKFPSVLIDESTQACEPECLIPIAHGAKQLILVGDHQQLGPVISSRRASDAGLSQSLFERLILLGCIPLRLEVQYRMHPCLSEFSSDMFYEGSLQNGVSAADRMWPNSTFPWPIREIPMMFWAMSGTEEIAESGTSYLNRVEAMNCMKIITRLFKDGVKPGSIGVITPYEGQRNYISQYLQLGDTVESGPEFGEVEVASVDAFQGREKDYIILTCVRANQQHLIGFLRDPRRLNVALTRAKYGCILLGDPVTLNSSQLWHLLLSYYRDRGCLVEGQLENLQISTVKLERRKPTRYSQVRRPRGSSIAPSVGNFDTGSMVSYQGSTFTSKLSNRHNFPSISEAESNSEVSTLINSNYEEEDEEDGEEEESNSDHRETDKDVIDNFTKKFANEFKF